MKKLFYLLIILLFAACSGRNYYQAYKAFADNIVLDGTPLVFENEDFIITYHLSNNINEVGYTLYNKTDMDLNLRINQSYFVLNGQAFTYSLGKTMYTKGKGVANPPLYPDNNLSILELLVPSKSAINLTDFKVNQGGSKNTNLDKFLAPKDIRVVKRGAGKSDFDLYSVLIYTLTNKATFESKTKFYVNEIANTPKVGVIDSERGPFIANFPKLNSPIEVYKSIGPDLLYLWGDQ